jgi:hypothetical protein
MQTHLEYCKPEIECTCLGDRLRRGMPGVKIRHALKGDCRDYRSDLARFPGDPQAYVDGPRALERLKTQRQREGWEFHKDWSHADAQPAPMKSGEQIAREAYEAAAARGFNPSSDSGPVDYTKE